MHKTLRCTCGRIAHFPKHAKRGHQWECYRCGTVWTIVPSGTGSQRLVEKRSRAPGPNPQVVVLPVLRETIRELPPLRQQDPFLPDRHQLPAPSRRPQATIGCLPAFLAMIGIGGGVVWSLIHLA
jgi:hypothetical protein